jgi:hypothetical protein
MSQDVDDFLAHYGVEADDELKHYGKKGMKWGKRKDGSDLSERKLAKVNRQADRGDARVERAGSAQNAKLRILGREAATQVLLGVGSTVVSNLVKDQRLKVGIAVAANLAATGTMVKSINDVVDINQASNRDEG